MADPKPWTATTYIVMIASIAALATLGGAIVAQSWQMAALAALGWLIAVMIAVTIEAATTHRHGQRLPDDRDREVGKRPPMDDRA